LSNKTQKTRLGLKKTPGFLKPGSSTATEEIANVAGVWSSECEAEAACSGGREAAGPGCRTEGGSNHERRRCHATHSAWKYRPDFRSDVSQQPLVALARRLSDNTSQAVSATVFG